MRVLTNSMLGDFSVLKHPQTPVSRFKLQNSLKMSNSQKFHHQNSPDQKIPSSHQVCLGLFCKNIQQRIKGEGVEKAGLEIISRESPDTMTGQIHFSSVTYRFSPVKLYKINNS